MKNYQIKRLFLLYFCLSFQFAFLQDNISLGLPNTGNISSYDYLTHVAFSQNGQLLITTAKSGNASVWETNTGRLLYTLEHYKQINFADFSPNEQYIVTTSKDKTAKIWEVSSGKLLQTLHLKYDVWDAEFSSESQFLKTNTLPPYTEPWDVVKSKIWEVKTGKLLIDLNPNSGYYYDKKVTSFDGNYFFKSDYNGNSFWDIKTNEPVDSFVENNKSRTESKTGGKYKLYYFRDTLNLYNNFKREIEYSIAAKSIGKNSASISPNGAYFAFVSGNYSVQIRELESGKVIHQLEQGNFISGLQYGPKGNYLAVMSQGGIKLWNPKNGQLLKILETKKTFWDTFVEFPLQENHLLSYNNRTTYLWNLSTAKVIKTFKGFIKSDHLSDSLTNTKKFGWYTDENQEKHLIDRENNKIINLTDDGNKLLPSVFSVDEQYAITLNKSRSKAKLWNTENWESKYDFHFGTSKGFWTHLKFSPNNNYFAFGGERILKVWDVFSGELKYTFDAEGEIRDVWISPDEKEIVISTFLEKTNPYERLGGVKIWNLEDGSLIKNYEAHKEYVLDSKLSHSKKLLLTASGDKTAKLWDLSSDSVLFEFKHKSTVNSIDFSSDDQKILTSSEDGTTKIWNTKTGKFIIQLIQLDSTEYLFITPEGYYQSTSRANKQLYYVNGKETLGFEQLDLKFNRPDKVLKTLGKAFGNPDTTLIKAYHTAWQKRMVKMDVDTSSFSKSYSLPKSFIVNGEELSFVQSKKEIQLNIVGIDSNYTLEHFNIWINEVPIFGKLGVDIKGGNRNYLDTLITLNLSSGINKIECSFSNSNGIESYRQPLYLKLESKKKIKSTTYFIGIGVDDYLEDGHNLSYSVKDIQDLEQLFVENVKDDLVVKTLYNEKVNLENILLLKKTLQNSGENDKVILAYSGHGLLNKNYDYFLSTYNIDFQNPEKNGLPYETLEWLLNAIPARKKLVFIDACHSGEVDKEGIQTIQNVENDSIKGVSSEYSYNPNMGLKSSFQYMEELFTNVSRGTGTTIISAASGTQFAYEYQNLANGVFTYSVLKALNNKKNLTIQELKQIVEKEVEQLTNGLQVPTSRNETIEFNWILLNED